MARLTWSTVGERYFEAGIDRGVLYVDDLGYAWNGLTSVNETPSGGDPQPYYLDGFKYLNIAANEEFEASIEAFSAPSAFDICDGTAAVANGLFATQQPRWPFGLSYRTGVGNDIDGIEHGYKIHLVYNALAKPTTRSYSTLNASTDPTKFSWDITTLPPMASGIKPTAHFVIDSRLTPDVIMTQLESRLYGTDVMPAELPSVEELQGMFSGFVPYKLVEIEPDVYVIMETDDADGKAFLMPYPVNPSPDGEPLLWLDNNYPGFVVPYLITGG